jgi:hypothetical protein
MTRGITVKVPTDKVLTMLKTKLAEMEQQMVDYPAKEEEYKKALKAWEQACLKYAIKNSSKAQWTDASTTWTNNSDTVKVTLWFKEGELPKRPKNPNEGRSINGYQWHNDLEELRHTIKLLEMHDGDHISTATYKNVARFL